MLLAHVLNKNKVLRHVNKRQMELLDLERSENKKLNRDIEVLTAKLIQAHGLLNDTSSIVRHESDYSEVFTEQGCSDCGPHQREEAV